MSTTPESIVVIQLSILGKMDKIALFTVFYPGAEQYADEFIESVTNQTYKDFDLLMVNDGYSLSNLQSRYPHLRIIEIEGNNTISGNRAIGINYAIQNSYDTIFLCDVDDYMTPNRVDVSIAALSDADIVVNDLDIVDANRNLIFKDYFQKTIKSETILDSKFIESKNIFGFSNTALRVSKLEEVKFPSDLRIVDWYYFTQLLNDGLKAKFIPQSLTEYRQHSGNMIGISSFTLDGFKNLLKLKIRHYSYFKDTYHGYADELSEMLEIAEKSNEQLKEIIKKNTSETPYPLWWQNVKL